MEKEEFIKLLDIIIKDINNKIKEMNLIKREFKEFWKKYANIIKENKSTNIILNNGKVSIESNFKTAFDKTFFESKKYRDDFFRILNDHDDCWPFRSFMIDNAILLTILDNKEIFGKYVKLLRDNKEYDIENLYSDDTGFGLDVAYNEDYKDNILIKLCKLGLYRIKKNFFSHLRQICEEAVAKYNNKTLSEEEFYIFKEFIITIFSKTYSEDLYNKYEMDMQDSINMLKTIKSDANDDLDLASNLPVVNDNAQLFSICYNIDEFYDVISYIYSKQKVEDITSEVLKEKLLKQTNINKALYLYLHMLKTSNNMSVDEAISLIPRKLFNNDLECISTVIDLLQNSNTNHLINKVLIKLNLIYDNSLKNIDNKKNDILNEIDNYDEAKDNYDTLVDGLIIKLKEVCDKHGIYCNCGINLGTKREIDNDLYNTLARQMVNKVIENRKIIEDIEKVIKNSEIKKLLAILLYNNFKETIEDFKNENLIDKSLINKIVNEYYSFSKKSASPLLIDYYFDSMYKVMDAYNLNKDDKVLKVAFDYFIFDFFTFINMIELNLKKSYRKSLDECMKFIIDIKIRLNYNSLITDSFIPPYDMRVMLYDVFGDLKLNERKLISLFSDYNKSILHIDELNIDVKEPKIVDNKVCNKEKSPKETREDRLRRYVDNKRGNHPYIDEESKLSSDEIENVAAIAEMIISESNNQYFNVNDILDIIPFDEFNDIISMLRELIQKLNSSNYNINTSTNKLMIRLNSMLKDNISKKLKKRKTNQ